MVPSDNLFEVDKLCRWLDLPFLINEWTRLQKHAKERTLRQYVKVLDENASYGSLDWSATNERWKNALAANTLNDYVPAINE